MIKKTMSVLKLLVYVCKKRVADKNYFSSQLRRPPNECLTQKQLRPNVTVLWLIASEHLLMCVCVFVCECVLYSTVFYDTVQCCPMRVAQCLLAGFKLYQAFLQTFFECVHSVHLSIAILKLD